MGPMRPGPLVVLVLAAPALADPPAEPPAAPPAPATAPATAPTLRLTPYGFLRLKGGIVEDDPNVAFVGRNDGFVLQNARAGLAGAYGEWLGFRISADGAVDEREGRNATLGTLRFALKDAYADLRAVPEVVVRGGRWKIMFDLDEIEDETRRLFVDEALETRGVFPTQGYQIAGLAPGRSLGVAVRSDEAIAVSDVKLGYEVAVQNGNGEYESANDSDLPAVSLALFARFPDRSLAFVAGRWKSRAEGELPFRQTEVDYEGNAGVRVEIGPLHVAGQVVARHTVFETTGGPARNSVGAHGELAGRIDVGGDVTLEPAYRYAIFDPSDLIDTDLVQEHTLGVTLRVPAAHLRVQLNATHAVEQAGRELANDRLEAVMEVDL
jgi:hypothetical protein